MTTRAEEEERRLIIRVVVALERIAQLLEEKPTPPKQEKGDE